MFVAKRNATQKQHSYQFTILRNYFRVRKQAKARDDKTIDKDIHTKTMWLRVRTVAVWKLPERTTTINHNIKIHKHMLTKSDAHHSYFFIYDDKDNTTKLCLSDVYAKSDDPQTVLMWILIQCLSNRAVL